MSTEKINKLQTFIDNRLSWDIVSNATNQQIPKQHTSPVFILCPARSGSTLLRVMLGGSSGLFAPPELELLSFTNMQNRKMSLSVRLEYMLDGLVRAVMSLWNCSADVARERLEHYETQAMLTPDFYAELQQWCGSRRLVDKSVHYAMSLQILERAEQYFDNAFYIHLSRHPYGTINSIENLRLDNDLYGAVAGYTPEELAEYTWQLCHQNILSFLDNVPAQRQIHIRFEDLVAAPEATMRHLCDCLHVPFHPDMLEPHKDKQQRMTDAAIGARTAGDPNFHQHTTIDSQTAHAWKKTGKQRQLTLASKATATQLRYWDVSLPRQLPRQWLQASNLSILQWNIWLASRQADVAPQRWQQTWRFELSQGTAIEPVKAKLLAWIQSSATLRSKFVEEAGIPQRKVLPVLEQAIDVWEAQEHEASLDERITQLPLNPLHQCCRCILVKLSDSTWLGYLTLHQLVSVEQDAEQASYLASQQFAQDAAFWGAQERPDPLQCYGNSRKARTTASYLCPLDTASPAFWQLQRFADQAKTGSIDSYLATALAITLHQVADVAQIGIGMPVSRLATGTFPLAISHTLPVVVRVDNTGSIRQLQQQISQAYQIAQQHSRYAVPNPVDAPLYEVTIQHHIPQQLQLDYGELNCFPLLNGCSTDAITLHVHQDANQRLLNLTLECNPLMFSADFSALFTEHFQQVLVQVLSNADADIGEIHMLSEQESRLMEIWNATDQDFPLHKTLVDLFEAQVDKTPDSPALFFGQEQWTYRQLNEQVNRVAHYLLEHTVCQSQQNPLIAICVERSALMLVGLLGILKAGAAYVPVDPSYPLDRIRYMLSDSQAPVILTQRSLRDVLPAGNNAMTAQVFCLDDAIFAENPIHNPPAASRADDLAYVIYTSGSTGNPKGVMLQHNNLSNFLQDMQQRTGITVNDRLLAVTTISFDIAALELYLPLISGSQLYLADKASSSNARALQQQLAEHQISFMQATPATWQLLRHNHWQAQHPLTILCGGEALPPDLANYLLDNCQQLWNVYGPTETTIWSTACLIAEKQQSLPSIGVPLANTQIYMLDKLHRIQPIGLAGELCIAGAGLARGYLNNPVLTAEKFIPHPFKIGERLYKTGDLARWLPDGSIDFLGRIDRQLKIRGYRVETGEIEQALLKHPLIQNTVVVGYVPDASTSKELAAYLVTKPEQVLPTLGELRHFLAQTLPAYMIPVYFTQLPVLPLTSNGKVNHKALPPPDLASMQTGGEYVASRNPVETTLVDLWKQVLQCERIGIHDNFFELGGHSIRALQLSVLMSETFHMEIPPSLVFQSPTIATLATKVGEFKYGDYHYDEGIIFNSEGKHTLFVFPIIFGLGIDYEPLTKYFPDTAWYCFDFLVEENRLELYYELIKKHQPQGPYVFLGNSVGGSLAFATARYLEARGEVVSDLILGDTLVRLADKPFDFQDYLDDFFAHWIDTPVGKQLLLLIQNEMFYQKTAARLTTYNTFVNQLSLDMPVQANIHQLMALEDDGQDKAMLSHDWTPYTTGTCTVYSVPGKHGTLFEPPHLEQNVTLVRTLLRDAFGT